ncbi:bifunctional diaminohydroxyphosphoribosylaminopyrimidine deaminase/5-amino-6-(5-phosphoribosylamino)uracil reductase RibD [Bacillus luteus]|uniref:Riboflavin biosynthesis protein RibD n=1 Tax=Alkalicoccus luteus TaxID=1237094 RepID=A0A969PSR5_9BACI|nr:bifunctional diaminohydroxyphosphoribosylaminopyrimidine deaminase/5-amino-6-(5-phosphoribosylamino)uracil reductase RibD [Alkalicoccus luteus]NJP38835.1 bifunctional diaminohydroxyphosphoribosylaminopyrimidine deaminase/5-amino-6-(5-phosphoribosylamino)uracil reductase RibD [Alkalicoccus luteus]
MTKKEYMKLAVELASAAGGQTSPNPQVGCVIVKDGRVAGVGTHLKAGDKHAERHALEMAGTEASGADMYVTLEPCSHHGRTPPCADAVIAAGISRVFTASSDPDPRVSGRGIKKLLDAGIHVETGIMKEEADELNRRFFHYVTTRKPYVTLKIAASIDGKTATSSGESKWITGPGSRLDGHRLRHEHDAILVGIETVLADDPELTVRLPEGGIDPVRIVLDNELRFPLQAKMLQVPGKTIIFTSERGGKDKERLLKEAGAEVIRLSSFRIEPEAVLEKLGAVSIGSLLIEGGGTVLDSFVRAGLFQEAVLYQAPIIIGGRNAVPAVGGSGMERLSECPRLVLKHVEQLEQDLKLTYRNEVQKECSPEL